MICSQPNVRLAALFVLIVAIGKAPHADACPFCSAPMQTLNQEIASADAALIAQLIEPMTPAAVASSTGVGVADGTMASAKFRIVKVLRGEEKLDGAEEIEVVYFGEDPPEKKFLITGLAAITPEKIEWTTPVPLSERAVQYVEALPSLPEAGAERLLFFQEHLEDEDPLLAQDSYDEFARAPYEEIVALGPNMKRERLLQWINDPAVGPSGRRQYLTFLGICGKPEDVGMLEELMHYDYQLMKPGIAATIANTGVAGNGIGMGLIDEMVHADDRRKKESLDSLIACYLKLKGPSGLELVNEKFLGNPTVEYKHLHSAIMALRFHGEETDVLPREKLLESMRLALDHKEFADQVIPDLTRWQDWDVMPRLVTMFKEAPKDDWIRQPVASYVLVAVEQPGEVGERAKVALAELTALDPETVERAESLSAFSFLARAATPTASAEGAAAATGGTTPVEGGAAMATVEGATVEGVKGEGVTAATSGEKAAKAAAKPAGVALPAAALPVPSRVKIIGIPLLAALVLLAIFAVLLRGTDPRSSEESPNT